NLRTDCIDVLLLHVWSRAWNRDPQPLETLRQFKAQGKIRAFGISTPDHDQDQLNALLQDGRIEVVQLAYNLFEQQPAAEALPLAAIKFALSHPAMSTVIPGMRNVAQVEANVSAAALPGLPEPLLKKLQDHIWLRGNWHAGK